MGTSTADYCSQTLPAAIRTKLQDFIQSIGGRLDRSNIVAHEAQVTALIKDEIEMLEKSIGTAVREICPLPEKLTKEEARALIKEHHEILWRAFSGTTLVFALINVDEHFMWAAGVGDSSVGECISVGGDVWHLLNTLHRYVLYREQWEAEREETVHDAHISESTRIFRRNYAPPGLGAATL